MTYLVGTDIGTMGAKSVLVDLDGRVKATAFEEYGVITLQQGWAEQWPDIWVEAAYRTIERAVETSKVDARDIAGACISSLYGGSGIPCDREMKPLRPCIIWADRRAREECDWVRSRIGVDEIFRVTGNVIDPYYGFTKMLWIKRHEPDIWHRINRLITPNAYCIHKLTGVESIDISSAGNYGGIFDIEKRRWSEEMMEELEIPRDFFPEKIMLSEEVVGEIDAEGSRLTGLRPGTPVCAGGIDAPVSALSGGAFLDGDLGSMLGTSMCNGFISHHNRLSPRLVNFPYVINGKHYLYSFTGISTAGYCVRWFRDELGKLEKASAADLGQDAYQLLDKEAENVTVGSNGLIFLLHLMGGERAPYWDENLGGGFLGLSVFHTKHHLFRAILEGVAYAMRYSIEAAKEAGIPIKRVMLVNGGARSALWRQIIADVTGLEMEYILDAIGAPLGDALLAGIGSGCIRNHFIIEDWLEEKLQIVPSKEKQRIYEKYYKIYKESLEGTRALFKKLGEITNGD